MSYCVNCGVELDRSAKACPLCNTPVINPNELLRKEQKTPFPQEKGQVETARDHKPDYLTLSQAERERQEKERDFRIC